MDLRGKLIGTPVSRETVAKLERYSTLLIEENERQNLISRRSANELWNRHLLDSAQLLRLAPKDASWLDIGSGAGLPGMVLAILGVRSITLVEPRRLRTDFLQRCVAELQLDNVEVVTAKAETLQRRYDVITARAVASVEDIFSLGERLTTASSHWVLPKGRSAAKELEEARATWQGDIRLEPSLTDPEARILVASGVKRKAGRG